MGSSSLLPIRLRASTLLKALLKPLLFLYLLLLTLCSCYFWLSAFTSYPSPITRIPPPSKSANYAFDRPPTEHKNWTKIIWQTSKVPALDLPDEDRGRVATWAVLNPAYRHELMTDARMESYVRSTYGGTQVENVYFSIKDHILRSDMIRYLILLAEGGVYNDLDVGCEKAIDLWVPEQFEEYAGVVLGVEVDNKFGPDGRTWQGGEDLFELVNWTIMAKAGQPFLRFLVQRVLDNLVGFARGKGKSLAEVTFSVQDVLDTTGPAALTRAFFDYASGLTGEDVTYKNFTKITKPRLIGEVVILPIHAFGAGHQVEWAGFTQDKSKVLVHHYFKGSWKEDHDWGSLEKQNGGKNEKKEEEEVVTVEEKVLHVMTEHAIVTATGSEAVQTSSARPESEDGDVHIRFLEPPDHKVRPRWMSTMNGEERVSPKDDG